VIMIIVGSYQGLCSMWRVATFDMADLPDKVGSACGSQQRCSKWVVPCGLRDAAGHCTPDHAWDTAQSSALCAR
jgi:hypothetical protein